MKVVEPIMQTELPLLIVGTSNCLLRTAVSELLVKDGSIKQVHQVDSPEEALKALAKEQFSLTVIFVSHPITTLLSKLARLSEFNTRTMLVLDSTDKFAMYYFTNYSIDGLISTDSTYQEFKSAIRTISLKNQKYISPSLITTIKCMFQTAHPFSNLSRKEMDVVLFIMNGKRNLDIAQQLNISQKTVSTYKTRIYKKLAIKNDAQLFTYLHQYRSANELQ